MIGSCSLSRLLKCIGIGNTFSARLPDAFGVYACRRWLGYAPNNPSSASSLYFEN